MWAGGGEIGIWQLANLVKISNMKCLPSQCNCQLCNRNSVRRNSSPLLADLIQRPWISERKTGWCPGATHSGRGAESYAQKEWLWEPGCSARVGEGAATCKEMLTVLCSCSGQSSEPQVKATGDEWSAAWWRNSRQWKLLKMERAWETATWTGNGQAAPKGPVAGMRSSASLQLSQFLPNDCRPFPNMTPFPR